MSVLCLWLALFTVLTAENDKGAWLLPFLLLWLSCALS